MATLLRPDQQRVLADVVRELRRGRRRVLVQAPTAWGKSQLAAALLTRAAAKGRRGLFVAHLSEICLDLAGRLRADGVPVELRLGGAAAGELGAPLCVASIQTLHARGEEALPPAALVFWDEAHRTAAPTYRPIQNHYADAVHVGLSATPEREDGAALDFYEVLIPGPQPGQLVDLGILPPVAVFAPAEHLEGALARDPVEAWPANEPGILFAGSVVHSRDIAAGLRARGLRAAHVDGDTPDRGELVAQFNSSALDVLTCYRLFVEGVNAPRASVVALASSFSSAGAYLQAIGRGRRRHAGKARTLVLDLAGNVHRHGHPDAERTYHLTGRPIRLAEGLPPVTQCPSCLGWGPPGRSCPACGATFPAPPPPRVKARDLVEVRRAEPEDSKRAAFARMVRRSREAGRSPWQAVHVYRGTYGEPPPRAWTTEEILGGRA